MVDLIEEITNDCVDKITMGFNNKRIPSVAPAKKATNPQPTPTASSYSTRNKSHQQQSQSAQTQQTPVVQSQPAITGPSYMTSYQKYQQQKNPTAQTQQPASQTTNYKDDNGYTQQPVEKEPQEDNNFNIKTTPNIHRKKYGVTVDENPMSVKEQIDFYVQNGMSFMLHGQSGVGKTARVEEIDSDLTAVPLWNGVLPEDIVGKVRYPDGTMIEATTENISSGDGIWVAPDWYTELCKKCEREPDKMHVLFIDEVTNARPTTQSLIFHITLKKSISPSKGQLPSNSVVVLAGNSKEESGAAYNMPEPLFRRMCGHIYLKPNVIDWIEWGSEESIKHPEEPGRQNIHPLVSSFVATYGKDVFYSEYDEEDPKSYAIDPRGWEQVSDIIYDNQGVVRRELLESKLGKNISASFMAFAQNPPLSVEDIINNDYYNSDIPKDSCAQIALTYNLRHVDDKHMKTIRDFIRNNLGEENCKLFDSLWAKDNDERALRITRMSALHKER